ncbi:hypothetical protein [Paenibacillus alkalitolerans]|uniref:hypothetical protein n=1 Tax=Paenibacillus alkalitolerans TaxID=2799335 RepID=UPI0018F66481|nr:hypothetical protein [Paenibacillus alkalitolerans]
MHQPPKSQPDSDSSDQRIPLWKVYLWSLSYLKPYLGMLLLLVATTSVLSAAELLVPKFIQLFIDVVIPHENRNLFYQLIFALLGVIGLVLAASMLQNLIRRHLQEKTARDV